MDAFYLIFAVIVACSAAVHVSYYMEFLDGPTWEDHVSRVTSLIFFLLEGVVAVVLFGKFI